MCSTGLDTPYLAASACQGPSAAAIAGTAAAATAATHRIAGTAVLNRASLTQTVKYPYRAFLAPLQVHRAHRLRARAPGRGTRVPRGGAASGRVHTRARDGRAARPGVLTKARPARMAGDGPPERVRRPRRQRRGAVRRRRGAAAVGSARRLPLGGRPTDGPGDRAVRHRGAEA